MGAEETKATGPEPHDGEAHQPCRHATGIAIRAFLDLLSDAAQDGKVGMDTARRIGAAILSAEGPLSEFYYHTQAACEAGFALHQAETKRVDALGRLVTQSFARHLDVPGTGLERRHLPQFFAALRLILGEETHEELKAAALDIAERHHEGGGGLIAWEQFYADPEAQAVLERVQVTIARSFRRFDPRKDWFLIVMNSNPNSVSLGSSVFVPKRPEDKAGTFGEAQMCRLFTGFFASMRPDRFDSARKAAFTETWGQPPEKIFGPLFVEVTAMAQRTGVA